MKKADLAIFSDAVFTGEDRNGTYFAGGIAICDDTIAAVGSREKIRQYCDKNTEIYEFGKDSLLMPAFNDGHMHLDLTLAEFIGAKLRFSKSADECVERVIEWAEENTEYDWIFGFGWQYTEWDNEIPPNNLELNKLFPNKPVCLLDIDGHAVWVNDLVLQMFNITKDSPDPPSTTVSRFADGAPTGYVQEGLAIPIFRTAIAAFEKNFATRRRNMRNLLRECNSYGLTSVSQMLGASAEWQDVFEAMEKDQDLTCRINLVEDYYQGKGYMAAAEKTCARFPDRQRLVSFDALKLFYDGVGIGHTGWQLNPYNDRPDWCGEPVFPEAELREQTDLAIRTGKNIHIHACGDKAVRVALDLWETAQKSGVTLPEQRYTITHNDTVDPLDIPRFAQLGVTASMQPDMLAPCRHWKDNLYPSRYGEKLCQTCWPCRSLFESGAIIALSTDSPVGLLNPMYGIYRAVTRIHDDGNPQGGFIPEQKISLANCLWAYTYGDAYQQGKEQFLGSLTAGKKADITVLDKNLFLSEPSEYIGTKAKLTLLNGKIVYSQ